MTVASPKGQLLPSSFHLGLFAPGLRGGLDQAVEYLHNESVEGGATTKIYSTKGTSSSKAPFRFALTLATIVKDRVTGRLDGAHIHLASKGSTVRKVIIAIVLVALRVPYVLQLHGGGYVTFWEGRGPIARSLIRFLFTRARSVLVLGGPFKPLVVHKIGVPADRVVVVPNGIAAPINADRSVRAEVPNIIYMGRLHGPKGSYDLVQAFEQIQDLDWTAFLAGNGETDQVQKAVTDAGLDDKVTVEAWIDHDEIGAWLNRSTIFTLPSYTEAMSISLLEAMSYGLACVATPVGAHEEVIRDTENGLLVTAGDVDSLAGALRALISDPAMADRLGRQAQLDFDARYQAKAVKRQIEQIYVQSFLPSRGESVAASVEPGPERQ